MKRKKLKTIDIEVAVATYLNVRTNLIVPNISWGMFLHECDLLVLTPAGFAWEIEIKTTKADLIKDQKKNMVTITKKLKTCILLCQIILSPTSSMFPNVQELY